QAGIGARIRRRIISFPAQVRQLLCVRINGHIPMLSQFPQSADVIEVTMGHQNMLWLAVAAKTLFGRIDDVVPAAGHAGIQQNPILRRSRRTDEANIDDLHSKAIQIRQRFITMAALRRSQWHFSLGHGLLTHDDALLFKSRACVSYLEQPSRSAPRGSRSNSCNGAMPPAPVCRVRHPGAALLRWTGRSVDESARAASLPYCGHVAPGETRPNLHWAAPRPATIPSAVCERVPPPRFASPTTGRGRAGCAPSNAVVRCLLQRCPRSLP